MLAMLWRRLGHLAVWAGLYVAGAVVAMGILAGAEDFLSRPRDALAAAAAFCTGVGVYLLDRVKFADRLLDPADRRAHPRRYAFVARRAALLRVIAACMGVLGGVGAFVVHPLLAIVVAGAFIGGFVYAGRPAGSPARSKDLLIIKNAAVAVSIAVFAGALVLGARPELDISLRVGATAITIAAIVFADAVLCDLDDMPADRRYGTRTIPGALSAPAAWRIALAMHVAAGLAIASLSRSPGALVFAIALPLTTAILRIEHPSRVRDLIDARLALIALLAAAAAHLA